MANLPTCIRATKQLPVEKTYVLVSINDNVIIPEVDHAKTQIRFSGFYSCIFQALGQDIDIWDIPKDSLQAVYHISIELMYQG